MKRNLYLLPFLLIAAGALLAGCGKGEEIKAGTKYVYYVNTNKTALVKQAHEWRGNTAEEAVQDILDSMKEPADSIEYLSAMPKGVKIKDMILKDGKLDLYFGGNYMEMEKPEEVLLRAAIVQSLEQVRGVEMVSFFVDGNPLTDKRGQLIGYMQPGDFVKCTGPALNSYQKATLNLYYSNANGNRLTEEKVSIRYNSNMSLEKLIVEQLLRGPAKEGARPTFPPETKLLGVTVKDGICYVNFDSGFLGTAYEIDPKVVIYSLVNSITEGSQASQVQISVNGETNINYQGTVDLSKPISKDTDLVEEMKKQ